MKGLREKYLEVSRKVYFKTIGISILGLVLFFISGTPGKAQNIISTYTMSALKVANQRNFDIYLGEDNSLNIDVYSTYKPEERSGFIVKEDLQPDFINTFEIAKNQYTEWKSYAIANNMTEVKMKMDLIFFTEGYFTFHNELKSDKEVNVIFAFTYYNGNYVLIMNLDNMTASGNELISFNGASIVFNSEKEIDSFLNKISPEQIRNYSERTKPPLSVEQN